MDDMQAIEQRITRELHRRAGPSGPVDDAAILTAVTTTTQSPKWRFQSMFSATKFVVAGAIVALFGGFLLAGVMTQPSDEPLPAAAASATAATEARPTDTATSEPAPTATAESETMTTTPDLLPGVDLVTEEVEPGVYRVVSDGVREPSRVPDDDDRYEGGILDGNIVAGLDGSVWWFNRDGFFRVGQDAGHRWPEGLIEHFRPGQADIEVGPDGAVWMTATFGVPGDASTDISSYDGQAWSNRWRGTAGKRWAYGVEVQQDGTVWMAWSKKTGDDFTGPAKVARLGDDDWEVVPGTVKAGDAMHYGDVIVSDAGGGGIWLMPSGARLHHHDGQDWVMQPTPKAGGEVRADVGPEGTLWAQLHPTCGPDTGCGGPSGILARLDGEDWEVFDSSNGIPMMGSHYQGFRGFFEVARDHSIWFNPVGDGTACDGIANFDGEAITYFLRDTCIYAMDIAPDGRVWLQAGEYRADLASGQDLGDVRPGPIHTYVITPEAVAGTE